mmetsp:Transcript_57650/g.105286  ORF Transcript_57650/g.105286 Transcript_57650/m.105286 type:complete len:386 (+) Transcript_57650:65-1222(+)
MKRFAIFFIMALITSGTLNTLTTKMQFTSKSIDKDGEEVTFSKPWFVTLNMLAGMFFVGLVDKCWRALRRSPTVRSDIGMHEMFLEKSQSRKHTFEQKVLIMAIPAALDMFGVALLSLGMMYLPASIWQMLRGGSIIFCGIFSVLFLKRKLYAYHWLGIFLCLCGLGIVGVSSVLGSSGDSDHQNTNVADLVFGMGVVLAGQAVQAGQVIAEEYLMKDIDIPAMQIVGWEGFWGTLLMIVVVYPLLWFLPGSDHGHVEDWQDTLAMLTHSSALMWLVALYLISCATYNASGISVTGVLSGTHRQMIDASRTAVIWIIGLTVHLIQPDSPQGEVWTNYSYLQLVGFVILLMGQSIYSGLLIIPKLYCPPAYLDMKQFDTPGSLHSP